MLDFHELTVSESFVRCTKREVLTKQCFTWLNGLQKGTMDVATVSVWEDQQSLEVCLSIKLPWIPEIKDSHFDLECSFYFKEFMHEHGPYAMQRKFMAALDATG